MFVFYLLQVIALINSKHLPATPSWVPQSYLQDDGGDLVSRAALESLRALSNNLFTVMGKYRIQRNTDQTVNVAATHVGKGCGWVDVCLDLGFSVCCPKNILFCTCTWTVKFLQRNYYRGTCVRSYGLWCAFYNVRCKWEVVRRVLGRYSRPSVHTRHFSATYEVAALAHTKRRKERTSRGVRSHLQIEKKWISLPHLEPDLYHPGHLGPSSIMNSAQ